MHNGYSHCETGSSICKIYACQVFVLRVEPSYNVGCKWWEDEDWQKIAMDYNHSDHFILDL